MPSQVSNEYSEDRRPTDASEDHESIIEPQTPNDHIVLNLAKNDNFEIQSPKAKAKTEAQAEITPDESSQRLKTSTRVLILALVITCLFVGRFSVPSNETPCVVDKILNAFENANKFINAPGNEHFRQAFQILCSGMMDITFAITFGYWVFKARTIRLPVSLAVFYVTRALIQSIWLSPFPEGYWWYSPGIPSFVVPYGRGSDFFFSGHTGFLIICACEWHKLGFKKIRNFVLAVTAYTILILFVYRIHYTIDIFTAIIFAQWCFDKIDLVKEKIEKAGAFAWRMLQQISIEFAKIVYYN